ncbi:MAG: hypothetical protein CMC33_01000 [Flavobacteriaceae bacterium]|nr:hypothetical protein [Flavobacteriaceae bacterium]
MKNIVLIFLFTALFGQISQSDLNKISNEQLDLIRKELSTAKVNIPVGGNNVNQIDTNTDAITMKTKIVSSVSSPYYGYNYFKRDLNFYDNIPAPNDYMLGPGDQIVISFWGERNSRETFIIDKEGQIFYPDIGFINISNKTLKDAEKFLNEELSTIISTLEDSKNSTNIKVSLGELKSINVFFTGQISQPGLNLIHPFSDVFTAIVQAGGVNINGSLRNVEIIRSNSVVEIVDFYSFFLSGKNNFSKLRLLDGDIIHIPTVQNRVQLSGSITNGGLFEFVKGEFLEDLINYAGGLKVNASTSAIINSIESIDDRISDDNAINSEVISFNEFPSFLLSNGDNIEFLPISSVDKMVEVLGRVKRPGSYPGNASLKETLILSGGFEDPEFLKSINQDQIIILRKDENQFYSIEILSSFESSSNIDLIPGDKVFVYENIFFDNNYFFTLSGEFNKPGSYPFKKGITLKDAIVLGGGVTEMSSIENIILFEEFSRLTSPTNLNSFASQVSNPTMDFLINPNSKVIALPMENTILVQGNVYNPGLVSGDGISIRDVVELSGGYKKYTSKKRMYIRRANGTTEKARWKKLYAGDTLIVEKKPLKERDFDVTAFVADLSQTLANIAAILILVDTQND